MQDRPTAAELLATITDYLDGEVLPNVEGTLRYHTLVAANLTRILQREADAYPAAAAAEREALAQLLGEGSTEAAAAEGDDLAALNAELARRLRQGRGDVDFERRCWTVLLPVTEAKLAINKPGYDSYDMATEVNVVGRGTVGP
jgi:uncharacterized protein DUF6285